MSNQEQTLLIGPYRVHAEHRQGGSASVHRVLDGEQPSAFALKIAHADSSSSEGNKALANEYRSLAKWRHPQLCREHDFGYHDGRAYLICDWVGGHGLFDPVPENPATGNIPPDLVTSVLAALIPVVVFLHDRLWLHGDIKPDNLRWGTSWHGQSADQSHLYLLDMGLAGPFHDPARKKGAGTVGYVAPEILSEQPADGAADWYSIGCMMYEHVYGSRPFQSIEPAEEIAGHLEAEPDFSRPMVNLAPDYIQDLLRQLLTKDPRERIGGWNNFCSWLRQLDARFDPEHARQDNLRWHIETQNRLVHHAREPLVREVAESPSSCHFVLLSDDRRDCRPVVDALLRELRIARRTWSMTPGSAPDPSKDGSQSCPPNSQPPVAANANGGTTGHEDLTITIGTTHCDLPSIDGNMTPYRMVQLLPQEFSDTAALTLSVLGALPVPTDLRPDEESAQTFARHWADALHDVSSGLPTIACSIIDIAATRKHLVRGSGTWQLTGPVSAWPIAAEGLLAIYQKIMHDVGSDEHRVLDHAAVLGIEFEEQTISDAWPSDRSRLERAFTSLLREGVLVRLSETRLRFRLTGLARVWRYELPHPMRQSLAESLLAALLKMNNRLSGARIHLALDLARQSESWVSVCQYGCQWIDDRIKVGDHVSAHVTMEVVDDAVTRISDQSEQDSWRGRCGMARAAFLKAKGRVGESRDQCRRMLALGRRTRQTRLIADAAKALGDIYKLMRRHDLGVRILKRALGLYRTLNDEHEISYTLNNLGNIYWVTNDYDTALDYYRQALAIQRRLELDDAVASTLSNIASIHALRFEYDRARENYFESLTLKEKLGSPVETARTLNNLGSVAFETSDYKTAQDYYDRAARMNREAGERAEALVNGSNLLEVYTILGEFRRVIREGARLIREGTELGHEDMLGNIHCTVAHAFLHLGDFRLCHRHLEEAKDVTGRLTNESLFARLLISRAEYHAALEDVQHGLALLDESLAHAERCGDLHMRFEALCLRIRLLAQNSQIAEIAQTRGQAQAIAAKLGSEEKRAQLSCSQWLIDQGRTPEGVTDTHAVDSLSRYADSWWALEFRALMAAQQLELSTSAREAMSNLRVELESLGLRLKELDAAELRWRVLLLLGQSCLRLHDYEAAYYALNEAIALLSEIAETVDDVAAKARYSESADAMTLLGAIQKLDELMSVGSAN